MKASDFMTDKVITASPDDTILSVVEKMLEHRISAVPVVDREGRVVGIVSEGDLMNRPETETSRSRSWWLDLFTGPDEQARHFLEMHGTRASDVMTQPVVTATEDDSPSEIARKLERHHIKRVPIVRDDKLVGIVSRANLLRFFASGGGQQVSDADTAVVRDAILTRLEDAGVKTHLLDVTVTKEMVELWGLVETRAQIAAARAAAEGEAPAKKIVNHLAVKGSRINFAY